MLRAGPSAAEEPVLASIGVLSGGGTGYQRRREVMRQAWASDPPPAIAVAFVLRCGGLPADAPERSEPLVLCTGVSASEARFRGPILALLAWFRHAERAYPTASFFCKADDDTFVHLPAILSHLRAIPAAAAPHAIYGTFSWWHVLQHPGHHFLFSGFGGRRGGAISAASRYGLAGRCNATNVLCHGPFPFPNGPFFAVGRALAAAVTTAPGVTDDQAAFERLPAGHRRIVEDVWLGSAVWRHVGHTAPVQLFPLGHQGRLFNDAGGCNVTRDVAIFHVRYKHLHRTLVLRHFLSLHGCVAPVRWARRSEHDCCAGAKLPKGPRQQAGKQNEAGKQSAARRQNAVGNQAGNQGGEAEAGRLPVRASSFVPDQGLVGGRMLPPPGAVSHPWGWWRAVMDIDACQPGAHPGQAEAGARGAGGGASDASDGGAGAALPTVQAGEQVDLMNVSELSRLGVVGLLPAEARASAAALEEWLGTRFVERGRSVCSERKSGCRLGGQGG